MRMHKSMRFWWLIFVIVLAGCGISQERTPDVSESVEGGALDKQVAEGMPTLIQLQDPLDEPEYYCIDIPGFRATLDLSGALTAHTCKPNADDELFTLNSPAQGQIYTAAYNLCIQADSAEAGSALYLKECSDSPLQRFEMDNGQIQVVDTTSEALCVVVAAEEGEPTGGPSHLRRDLMLQPCLQAEPALSQWLTPGADEVMK